MTSIKAAAAVWFALLSGVDFAQQRTTGPSNTARITGRVVDIVQSPISKTMASLTAVGSARPTMVDLTDDDGAFSFDSVAQGRYVLRLQSTGFLSRRMQINNASTGQDLDLGVFVMEIGEVNEGPMFGEGGSEYLKLKPMTVCEALAGRKKLGNKPVAIVGRIDCGISLIDRVCFLTEERCEQPVVTGGHAWPNKVVIVDYWEEGMPKLPPVAPEIDQSTLLKKLAKIRKTTTLGMHKEPRFKTAGTTLSFSHFVDVKDQWGLAYGLFFTPPNLRKSGCGDEVGCGGFDGAAAALITAPNSIRKLNAEGKATPEE